MDVSICNHPKMEKKKMIITVGYFQQLSLFLTTIWNLSAKQFHSNQTSTTNRHDSIHFNTIKTDKDNAEYT